MNRIQSIITAAAFCGAAGVSAQHIPLPDSGFQEGGSGWALWTEGSVPSGSATLTFPTTGGRANSAYARFEVTTPSAENWHIQMQVPPGWDAVNGATYDLSFWAKSDSSSSFHFAFQDGPETNFEYRGGQDFALSPEWTQYTLTYTSDVEGNGALRFNLFLGATVDTYGFDDFSLVGTPVNIKAGTVTKGRQVLRVVPGSGKITLSVDGLTEHVKADLLDLRGVTVASTAGNASGLQLAHPGKSGTYVVRVSTATRAWLRTVALP